MYVGKNELINRLVKITGKDKKFFLDKTVKQLSSLYEQQLSDVTRLYLNVPYKDKDIVKILGARYDGAVKKWYVPNGAQTDLFKKWMPK